MTKQSQSHVTPEEKPNPELLLRRFKLMDEFVEDVRKKNIEAGLAISPRKENAYSNTTLRIFGRRKFRIDLLVNILVSENY